MSYLAILFNQTSYPTDSRMDPKSYATNCHIEEMVFDEISYTRYIQIPVIMKCVIKGTFLYTFINKNNFLSSVHLSIHTHH